jgi:hypothetical protein
MPEADPACKDASRAYWLPSHPPSGSPSRSYHAGALLDWSTLPTLSREHVRGSAVRSTRAAPMTTRRAQDYLARVVANLEAVSRRTAKRVGQACGLDTRPLGRCRRTGPGRGGGPALSCRGAQWAGRRRRRSPVLGDHPQWAERRAAGADQPVSWWATSHSAFNQSSLGHQLAPQGELSPSATSVEAAMPSRLNVTQRAERWTRSDVSDQRGGPWSTNCSRWYAAT